MGCGRSLPDTSNTIIQDRPIQVHVMFGTKIMILITACNNSYIILIAFVETNEKRVRREIESIKIFTIVSFDIPYSSVKDKSNLFANVPIYRSTIVDRGKKKFISNYVTRVTLRR